MTQNDLTGKFYDIQGFSVHDGPGIRTTCFMKGCPLRCLWCHSPESQAFPTELNWMEMKCMGVETCGKCLTACPKDAIATGLEKESSQGDGAITLVRVDRQKCDNCGLCAEACPAKALYMCGTDYTVEALMEIVRRDMPFYKTSGGGVTISGGECLYQPEYLLAVLTACKEAGVHTAVDTTGYADFKVIAPLIPYTDLFLYDLKHIDSDLHKQGTGVPNELILENAKKIAEAGGKMIIRIPIIPKYNDTPDVIDRLGRFIVGLGDAVEYVQLLPYHNLGAVKWGRLQATAPVLEAVPPSEELVEQFKAQLTDRGLDVIIH